MVVMISITYRCPEPTCREACERGFTGKANVADEPWVHILDQSPACGEPDKYDVAPDRVGWSGRMWRLHEAREVARRKAVAEARRIVKSLPQPMRHCGDCDLGLALSIEGVLAAAFEDGLAFAQDEYLRPHPVTAPPSDRSAHRAAVGP